MTEYTTIEIIVIIIIIIIYKYILVKDNHPVITKLGVKYPNTARGFGHCKLGYLGTQQQQCKGYYTFFNFNIEHKKDLTTANSFASVNFRGVSSRLMTLSTEQQNRRIIMSIDRFHGNEMAQLY